LKAIQVFLHSSSAIKPCYLIDGVNGSEGLSAQACLFGHLCVPVGQTLDPQNPVMDRWWMPEPVIAMNIDRVGNLLLIVLKRFTLKLAESFHRPSPYYSARRTLK
jgi:hypothetical protein